MPYFFAISDQTWPIKILGRNLLAFRRVEIFQISLRERASAALVDYFVDHRDRRLGKNADRRNGDLKFVGTELFEREKRFVLPRDQHVTYVAFDKGGGRTARAGVEHGNILV